MSADPRRIHRYPGLDGLRTWVILLVAVHHAWIISGQPHLDGGLGRDVAASGFVWFETFFLVSGFVLFLPAAQRSGRVDRRRFWTHRVLRILPLWLVVLLVIEVTLPTVAGYSGLLPWTGHGAETLLTNVGFVYLPFHGVAAGGIGADVVVWTLSIEVFFYALMPFVAKLVTRRPLLVAAVGVVVSREWVSASTRIEQWWPRSLIAHHDAAGIAEARAHAASQLPTYLGHFCIGMALAVLVVRHRDGRVLRLLNRWADVLLVGGLAWVVAAMAGPVRDKASGDWQPWGNYTHSGLALPGLVLLCMGIALEGPLGHSLFGNRIVVAFGVEVSFGFYLWHLLVMNLVTAGVGWPAQGTGGAFLVMLATIPISIGLALAGRFTVERPAMALARRLDRRSVSVEPLVQSRPAALSSR